MATRKSLFFAQDVDELVEPWLFFLPGEARMAWVMLKRHVKVSAVSQKDPARALRLEKRVAAYQWKLSEAAIEEMELAAVDAGALSIEGESWIVADRLAFQSDRTARRYEGKRDQAEPSDLADKPGQTGTNEEKHGHPCHVTGTGTGTGTGTVPITLLDWRRRIDGRWALLGDRLGSDRLVAAIEEFDRHRLRLLKGGLSNGIIEAFAQAVVDRSPSDEQVASFFDLVVARGNETPNVQLFHRFLEGRIRPPQGDGPPEAKPVIEVLPAKPLTDEEQRQADVNRLLESLPKSGGRRGA